MSTLAYCHRGDILRRRFADLFADDVYIGLGDNFAQQSCAVLGLPVDDPLATVYDLRFDSPITNNVPD